MPAKTAYVLAILSMLAAPALQAQESVLAAPAGGWLGHESCWITGEMLVWIAGRIARAFVAETPGVYRPSWTIEEVGEQIDPIRDTGDPWILPTRSGHVDHIIRSFATANGVDPGAAVQKGNTHVG